VIPPLNLPAGIVTDLPRRQAGWRGRVNSVLSRHCREPFVWGRHDCGILAADWIEAITGVDVLARYRGRYDSADSARAILAEDGFADHVEMFAMALTRAHKSAARYGDIAILEAEDGSVTTGPVLGEVAAVFTEKRGVGSVPLGRAAGVLLVR